ncbi:hypothetical protein AB0C81_21720 [Streptomyces roseoverticillatus]|uniref:hypothetical protein n=1 Tax=Streptomyces roseoverticillatus TaxID=66429 RepID=UPI0033D49600
MRSRALAVVTSVVTALFLALGLVQPAHAGGSGSPSPPDGVCLGGIHYTFDPPLQKEAQPTTITWSGTYSCVSPALPGLRAWGGTFEGSTQATTGCLQTGVKQVLAQGLEENDKWFVPGAHEKAGSSTLDGTVSTLPRQDGTRVYEWTGTVTDGTWFKGHHFNGIGGYTSLADKNLCLAGGRIDHNDGTASLIILPL